jgi:uncharacterized protein YukE
MTEARSLYVVLSANATQYKRTLDEASRATKDFGDDVDHAGDSLDGTGKEIDKFSGRMGLALRAVTAFGPAAIQMGAGAIPAITGLSNALAVTVAGAGTTILAFQGVSDALKAMNKAELKPTAENLEEARRQLANLHPEAARFTIHLQQMIPALEHVRNSAARGLFPGLDESLDNLETLIPRVSSMVREYGDVVGDLAADDTASIGSARWERFFDFLQGEARPTLTELNSIVGHLGHGLAELWMGMDPASDDFLDSLGAAVEKFDDWATHVDETEGFQDWLEYLNTSGRESMETLSAIADALLQIAIATEPIQGPALDALETFADVLGSLADSPAGEALFVYAAAASAASLATKGFAAAGGPRLIAGLRSQSASVRTVSRDLNVLATTWATAGAASQREQARMTAAQQRLRATFGGLAGGAAVLGGVAVASTGIAESMGMANTATFALTGAMIGGAPGAVAGGLVGAYMDAKGAAKEFTDQQEDLNRAFRSGDLQKSADELASSIRSVNDAVKDAETYSSFGDYLADSFDPSNPHSALSLFSSADEEVGKLAESAKQRSRDAVTIMSNLSQIAGNGGQTSSFEWLRGELGFLNMGSDAGKVSDTFSRHIAEIQTTAESVAPALKKMGLGLDALSDPDLDVSAVADMVQYLDSAPARMDDVGTAVDALGNDLLSTADSASQLSSALEALLSPKLNLEEATDAWHASLQKMRKDLNVKAGFTGDSEGAQANRALTRDYVEGVEKRLTAMAEAGKGEKAVARAAEASRKEFIRSGVAAGFSAEQMRRRANEMGLTPKLVKTVLEAAGFDESTEKAREFRRILNKVPKDLRAKIAAEGVPKTRAQVEALIKKYPELEKHRSALISIVDDATPKLNSILGLMSGLHDKSVTVTTYVERVAKNAGKRVHDADGGLHVGGVKAYADGGFGGDGRYYPRVSMLANGGANIMWAEEETGWEAYISGKPSQRQRNKHIWAEAGRRLGYNLHEAAASEHAGGRGRTVVVQSAQLPEKVELVVDGHRFTAYVRAHAADVSSKQIESVGSTESGDGRMNWP